MSPRAALLLYNAGLVLAIALGWPLLAVWVLRSPRLRASFAERLRPLETSAFPTVWVHAASVGETEAAVPLIRALERRGVPLRLTALSDTGRARLRERFPALEARLAPLDLPGLAGRSARRARVRCLVLIETELWPNTIGAVRRAGGAVLVASGRISDRSYPRYRALAWLLRPLVGQLDGVAARSEPDRARFVALGVSGERVRVVGDLKLDREGPQAPSSALRAAIGPGPLLVAGSTHPGEEEALLETFARLAPSAPELRLVLVPRHPERAGEVVESARARGLDVGRRSEGAPGARVVVVDTLGELASIYLLATLVFAGGTLVPVGGHNLFEAVAGGRRVVVGPYTHNQESQVEALEPSGALVRVRDAAELEKTLRSLWHERDRAPLDLRGRLRGQAGAAERILEIMERLGVMRDVGA